MAETLRKATGELGHGERFDDPDANRRAAALAHYRRELARVTDPADLLAGREGGGRDALPDWPAADAADDLEREAALVARLLDAEERLLFWRLSTFALLFLAAAQAAARWLP